MITQSGRPLPRPRRRAHKIGPLLLVFHALVFFQLGAAPSPALAAGKERIQNVTAEIVEEEITVSAELVQGFYPEIVTDIQNGIPKDFYYYLLLKRKQKNWFDEEIVSKTIRYTVKYDTLKKQYAVIRVEGEKVAESLLEDFESMRRLISKIDHVKIAPVRLLKSRQRYYVSVKAQMKAAKLPLYLDYFLFFIPFLELDTPWSDSGAFHR
ncbi:MAG TPA: DUF4390 domain-containing protein [Candidatus Manganitrophaceae bacterium]|nr:DUF4390 domain-containing protein [Candidatus Manganitrophaceae bacterium]